MIDREMAVIGAGIAGLATSLDLLKRGFKVTLIEARSDIGGRIRSFTLPGIMGELEAGANFIEGCVEKEGHDSYLESVAGLESVAFKLSDAVLIDGKTCYQGRQLAAIKDVARTLFSKTESYPDALSVEAAFERAYDEELVVSPDAEITPETYRVLVRCVFTAIYYGAERGAAIHELGNHYLTRCRSKQSYPVREGYASQSVKLVRNGYQRLPQALLTQIMASHSTEFQLWLGREVIEIKSKASGVTIKLLHGQTIDSVHFDAVVSTIPSGALQAKAHELFVPPLPAKKQRALGNIFMARANKVFLVFEEVFWHNETPILWFADPDHQTPIEVLNLAYAPIAKGPGLVFWFNDRSAEVQPSSELIAKAMAILKHTYGEAVAKLKVSSVTDWVHDPLAKGAWTGSGFLGESADSKQLLMDAMLERRVFFAGECGSAYGGSVHGAYTTAAATAAAMADYFTQGIDAILNALSCKEGDECQQLLKSMTSIKTRYQIAHERLSFMPLQAAIFFDNAAAFQALIDLGVRLIDIEVATIDDCTVVETLYQEQRLRLQHYLEQYLAQVPDKASSEIACIERLLGVKCLR